MGLGESSTRRSDVGPRLLEEEDVTAGLVGEVESEILGSDAAANVSLEDLKASAQIVRSRSSIHSVGAEYNSCSELEEAVCAA